MRITTVSPRPAEQADARPKPDELVARHYASVYNLAYRTLVRRADAEDIAQQTFVRALARVAELRKPAAAGAWLCRIAANLCMDEMRRRRNAGPSREPSGPDDPAWVASPDPDESTWAAVPDTDPLGAPAAAAELVELRTDVWRATLALAPQQRLALALRELHGMRYAEMAETLGLSVSAVETLLFRARQNFRRAYQARRGPAAASADCEWVLSRLSASIDAELGRIEQARVDAHLPGCPTCQFAARELRATNRLYALVPLVAPPAGAQAAALLAASGAGVGAAASALTGGSGVAASGAVGALASSTVAAGGGPLTVAAAGMGSAAAAALVATVGAAKVGLAATVAVAALVGVAWASGVPAGVASSIDRWTGADGDTVSAATPDIPAAAVPLTAVVPSQGSAFTSAVSNTASPTPQLPYGVAPVSQSVLRSTGLPTSGGPEVTSATSLPAEPVRALVTLAPAAAPGTRSTGEAEQPAQQPSQPAFRWRQPVQESRPALQTSSVGSTQTTGLVGEGAPEPPATPVARQEPAAEASSIPGRETQQIPERDSVTSGISTAATPALTTSSHLPAGTLGAEAQTPAGSSETVTDGVATRVAQGPPPVSQANTPTTSHGSSATSQPVPTSVSSGAARVSTPSPAWAPPTQPVPLPALATSPPARTPPAPTSLSPAQPAPTSLPIQPASTPPLVQPDPTLSAIQPSPTAAVAQPASSTPPPPTSGPTPAATARAR
jgi:RNA polymerase sigma factor (sigma-70 family)